MSSFRHHAPFALLGLCAALTACNEPGELEDAGRQDAGRLDVDAGPSRSDSGSAGDAAIADGGEGPLDAAAVATGVPVFVAVGWGGRRVTSCDLGRTWVADQQIAPEAEDDWHRPYTPKGLTFGAGRFVFLTGWGNPSTAYVSSDGVSWDAQPLDTGYGGVGWADGRYVLVGNRHLSASDDASTWAELTSEPAPMYDRATAAFDGVWAAGADGMVESYRPGVDDSWQPLSGCSGTRHGHIGFEGGFAMGGGILLSLGHDGDTCTLDVATGAALGAGTVGTPSPSRPIFADGAFHAVGGGQIHSSPDGRTWTSRDLPAGTRFELLAHSDTGTWVGVSSDGDRFFYSDDGIAWNEGTGPSGNGLLYLAFGRASASGCSAL